jgi:hypothetical protein
VDGPASAITSTISRPLPPGIRKERITTWLIFAEAKRNRPTISGHLVLPVLQRTSAFALSLYRLRPVSRGKASCSCSVDHCCCCPRWGRAPSPSVRGSPSPAAALTTTPPSPGTVPPVCRAAERSSPLGPGLPPRPTHPTARHAVTRGAALSVPSVFCPHARPRPPAAPRRAAPPVVLVSFRRDSRRPLVAGAARASATATTAFPLTPNPKSLLPTFPIPVWHSLWPSRPPLPSPLHPPLCSAPHSPGRPAAFASPSSPDPAAARTVANLTAPSGAATPPSPAPAKGRVSELGWRLLGSRVASLRPISFLALLHSTAQIARGFPDSRPRGPPFRDLLPLRPLATGG